MKNNKCSIKKSVSEIKGNLYVGIDVHKNTYSVAVWSGDQDILVKSFSQPSDSEALCCSLEKYKSCIVKIVYEAGPTGFGLVRILISKGYTVEVVSPSHIPEMTGDKSKSDRTDAKKLAQYASKNLLKAVAIPEELNEARREIFRLRDGYKVKFNRVKCQIKSFLLRWNIKEPSGLKNWSKASVKALGHLVLNEDLRFFLDELLSEYYRIESSIKKIDDRLRAMSETPAYKKKIESLSSVKGVGILTSMGYLLEMHNLESFTNGRQVSRIQGLSPLIWASGEIRHESGREPGGKQYLRPLLIEAAWRWVRYDPFARQKYNSLCMNTGNSKKAITGVARKLGILLWRLGVTEEKYVSGKMNVPEGVFKEMKNTGKKMKRENTRKQLPHEKAKSEI
jgi:transposase